MYQTVFDHGSLQRRNHRGKYGQTADADNAAMANFFGLLKLEIFCGEALVPKEDLKKRIERYFYSCNNGRIKQKLAGMCSVQYRTHASQSVA
ncbi:IS3 family transposase [Planococcus glaciei]|uniref:IS3 family transposase n=1 Tax=Planococcus glaciei TaxID=459472 RepID=UPI001C7367AE|nr:IS3 family transposase [Planococcus glaciei]MBX0314150.1 integrase core domain-containing protein [Planococcus glaciei]